MIVTPLVLLISIQAAIIIWNKKLKQPFFLFYWNFLFENTFKANTNSQRPMKSVPCWPKTLTHSITKTPPNSRVYERERECVCVLVRMGFSRRGPFPVSLEPAATNRFGAFCGSWSSVRTRCSTISSSFLRSVFHAKNILKPVKLRS